MLAVRLSDSEKDTLIGKSYGMDKKRRAKKRENSYNAQCDIQEFQDTKDDKRKLNIFGGSRQCN